MADPGPGRDGLFSALFDRGGTGPGDQEWLQAMLDAEAALARALESAGQAPPGAGAAVTAAARAADFDPGEIGRQAALTGNPVPALVRALSAGSSPAPRAARAHGRDQPGHHRHGDDAAGPASAASRRAPTWPRRPGRRPAWPASTRDTVMVGRTLLQQAVPVTFGLVAAGWLTAIDEARRRPGRVGTRRLAAQFGGAAGTLASLGEAGPAVAAAFAAELGLAQPVLPWHTDRLRLVELAAALAGACAATGKVARDVTLLAQSEVAEVAEGDAGGQAGGSSAMPHKRNPVAAVLVLGSTRRAPYLLASLTAAAEHEHQRAAGAWHAEWEPLADLLRLTGSAAAWAAAMLSGLRVDAARMRANLDAARGLPMAEHVTAVLAPATGSARRPRPDRAGQPGRGGIRAGAGRGAAGHPGVRRAHRRGGDQPGPGPAGAGARGLSWCRRRLRDRCARRPCRAGSRRDQDRE